MPPVANRPIRVGVLSLAHHHAESYLATLRQMPDVELVGLWDEDEVRGTAAADQAEVQWFASEAALLGSGVDGAIVTSVNSEHRRLVELAAASGAHVLCEKPLATRVVDGEAMIAACDAAGVRLMICFPMRWSPVIRALRASIDDGSIGQLAFLEGVNTGEVPDAHRAWFVDPLLAGGGAVTDHVVHLADLYRWLLGSEVVEVFAVANRILHGRLAAVETGALVSLRFADGVLATIDCSWSKPPSYPTWGGLAIEAVGTTGAVTADAFAQHLTLYKGGDRVDWPFWGSDPNRAMLTEFVAACRDQREAAVTGLDGLRALEIVDAAYRSIVSGEPIRLERP